MNTLTHSDDIAHFRLLTLRQALKLETLGLKRRGATALSILRKEGYVKSRTAKAALAELDALLGREEV